MCLRESLKKKLKNARDTIFPAELVVHWVADVVFNEDGAVNNIGHSAENLILVKRLVMNMVNLFDPSAGLAAARRFATHEPEYLEGMLVKLFGKAVKSFLVGTPRRSLVQAQLETGLT